MKKILGLLTILLIFSSCLYLGIQSLKEERNLFRKGKFEEIHFFTSKRRLTLKETIIKAVIFKKDF